MAALVAANECWKQIDDQIDVKESLLLLFGTCDAEVARTDGRGV